MGQNVAYGNSSNGPVVQHNVLAIDQRVADFIDATSATWKMDKFYIMLFAD
jgi:hypothetical protein